MCITLSRVYSDSFFMTVWQKEWDEVIRVCPLSVRMERSNLRNGPQEELSCTGNGVASTTDPEFSSLKD